MVSGDPNDWPAVLKYMPVELAWFLLLQSWTLVKEAKLDPCESMASPRDNWSRPLFAVSGDPPSIVCCGYFPGDPQSES